MMYDDEIAEPDALIAPDEEFNSGYMREDENGIGDMSDYADSGTDNSIMDNTFRLDDDSIQKIADALKEDEEETQEETDEISIEDEDIEDDEEEDLSDEEYSDLLFDTFSGEDGSIPVTVSSLPQDFYDELESIKVQSCFFDSIMIGLVICFIFVFGIKR